MATPNKALIDFFNTGYAPTGLANSTPMISPKLQTQILPNGGGSYNPAGASTITPAPIFTGVKPAQQAAAPRAPQRNFYKNGGSYFYADTNQKILDPNELGVAAKSGVEIAAPAGVGTQDSFYDKYKDPKTGKVMTPEEWGVYLGNKVPKGTGEITNYAADAFANPNQTEKELQDRANNLNNSRNDIATGTTDPYNIASQSGVPYSGAELKAIENAYAGIYDPALNDVFTRLKDKQAEEKKKSDLQQAKDLEVFKTNESIRQWRATTGTTPGATGAKAAKDMFTRTQLNTAARNAGLGVGVIEDMDPDLINFFISPKKAINFDLEPEEIGAAYQSWFDAVKNGDVSADEVADNINATSLSPAVKTYYIDQIPAEPEKKKGWLSNVWSAIIGQ